VTLFKFKLTENKQNYKLSSLVAAAAFQVLSGPIWLVVTILDNTEEEYSYHDRKLCGGALNKRKKTSRTFSAVAITTFTQGQFILGNNSFKEEAALPTKRSCLAGRLTVFTSVC